MKIRAMGKSDVGARRSNNEDSFVIAANQQYASVADGMGGAAAGEVASRIFVETVTEYFQILRPRSEEEVKAAVRGAFLRGNTRIIEKAREVPEYEGMGCTAELIAFFEDRYVVGHVGDSRSYLYRARELRQITKDHSLVQFQLDQGIITPEQAKLHSMKNVVLRAIGIEQTLSLDIIQGRVLPGDIYLLCSDGLSDMIPDTVINEILAKSTALDGAVKHLIDAALAAGGRDNVTIVLCEAVT